MGTRAEWSQQAAGQKRGDRPFRPNAVLPRSHRARPSDRQRSVVLPDGSECLREAPCDQLVPRVPERRMFAGGRPARSRPARCTFHVLRSKAHTRAWYRRRERGLLDHWARLPVSTMTSEEYSPPPSGLLRPQLQERFDHASEPLSLSVPGPVSRPGRHVGHAALPPRTEECCSGAGRPGAGGYPAGGRRLGHPPGSGTGGEPGGALAAEAADEAAEDGTATAGLLRPGGAVFLADRRLRHASSPHSVGSSTRDCGG